LPEIGEASGTTGNRTGVSDNVAEREIGAEQAFVDRV